MVHDLKARLLALAALRSKTVTLDDGLTIVVQEPSQLAFAEYGQAFRADRDKATAGLMAACVVGEDGQPLLTAEEALTLARSARVSRVIVAAVMELAGFREGDDDAGEA
jgi:hypothetical protein